MTVKKSTLEAWWGVLFTFPVIAGVLLFTIGPILVTFTYSVTDYNPLAVSQNRITINAQEELNLQLGLTPKAVTDVQAWAKDWDVAAFIDDGLGLGLSDAQRTALAQGFDKVRFAQDFQAGKLNQSEDGVALFSRYLGSQAEKVFPAYAPRFTGTKNYEKMWNQDQYFWLSMGNTITYALVVVIIQTILSILLAVGASTKIPGVGVFKIIFFLPAITSSSAMSMIFLMLYSKPGVINQMLAGLGISPIDWLNNPSTAIPAVIALNVYTTAGFFMVTFLAGLQGISRELYESAEIDGAKPRTVFTKITLPLLRPQIVYVMIMGTIGCLQVFDQIFFLIPDLRNGTMAFYIYRNAFRFGDMGYASALAVVLFLLIFAVTLLQRRYVKESVL